MSGQAWTSEIISVGAIVAIISVVPRPAVHPLQDHLHDQPRWTTAEEIRAVVPCTRTPVFSTWTLAGFLALLAAFVPLDDLAAAISLSARSWRSASSTSRCWCCDVPGRDLPRLFKVPFGPVIPCIAVLLNIVLMILLPITTWIVFVIWLVIGLLVYWFTVAIDPWPGSSRGRHSISSGCG